MNVKDMGTPTWKIKIGIMKEFANYWHHIILFYNLSALQKKFIANWQ